MKNKALFKLLPLVGVLCTLGSEAGAFEAAYDELTAVMQRAVTNNPDVQGKVATFNAAVAEKRVAIGAYLPKGDLYFRPGREQINPYPGAGGDQKSFNRVNSGVSLTQLIFDGMITPNDIRRLGYGRAARYFELRDSIELTAGDAARLYAEVMRYRLMAETSEQNYAQHKFVFDQIKSRVASGVGRKVDLDLATGRLALAESNHLNDLANLHDVTANYQRVVGELPPISQGGLPNLHPRMPLSNVNAMLVAAKNNAGLRGSQEGVLAAEAQASMRKGLFWPTVQLRLASDHTTNYTGADYSRRNNVGEIVANWNFLNGGSDLAKVKQYAELVNVAKDVRDKTCRDLRQDIWISWNNQRKLASQLELLDIHQRTTEAARNAFRAQFELGQRTLLDLLDTENELFNAKRNRINGGIDLFESQVKLLSKMGVLTKYMNVQAHQDVEAPSEANDELDDDVRGVCPAEVPNSSIVDRDDLNARAAQINLEANPPKNLAATPSSAAAWGATPGASVTPLVNPAPVQVSNWGAAPTNLPPDLQRALDDWQSAQQRRDVGAYLASYGPGFEPEYGLSRSEWEKSKARRFANAGNVQVALQGVKATPVGNGYETRFQQQVSGDQKYSVSKTLLWQKAGDRWQIQKESGNM